MKLLYTGSDFAAQEMWQGATNKQDFINHIYEHTQVTHDLGEPIMVDAKGHDNLVTVYGDGFITMHGPDPAGGSPVSAENWEQWGQGDENPISAIASTFGDLKEFDGTGRGSRKWKLEELFDDVFRDSIQHGLLLHKAVAKACEAVEGIEHIEAARNRVVSAQLDKEFPVDEN